MMNNLVLYELLDRTAVITLNNPDKLNALSFDLIEELEEAIRKAEKDEHVQSIILTGTGRAFSSGGNVTDFPDLNAVNGRKYLIEGHDLLKRIYALEKPVIAAVNGLAVGGGFNLALCCDFVLASEKAVFSQIFAKIGLVPDMGGMFLLPRTVGLQRAKELMYSGRKITAKEAFEYGIVLELVSAEHLMERAVEFAKTITEGAPNAIALTKSILNHSFESSFDHILAEEAMAQGIAFTTKDHREGVTSFFEKRQPQFSGR
ncbi:enoyl-CoA hydratase/isomerase family protein [Cytobacillus sp. Hm23]